VVPNRPGKPHGPVGGVFAAGVFLAGPELSGALGNGGMLLNHVLALDTAQRPVVPGFEVVKWTPDSGPPA